VGKIKAAVDARTDADLLIMARTDAAATHGFEAAIERAQKFSEAGADILFVEAVTSADEVRAMPRRLDKPQLMNMVIGGKTPDLRRRRARRARLRHRAVCQCGLAGRRGWHATCIDCLA
jgi:2-methylisocitrate lyase-like PEP mutase family enzyme